jgi:hypothetical protein
MKSLRMSLAIATAAIVLFAGGVSPVAAAQPDGVYGRLNVGNVKGLMVVSYRGQTSVDAGILGLRATYEYFLAGRSIDCAGTPAPGNRVFKTTAMTDGNGALFVRKGVLLTNNMIRSLWVGPADGSAPPVCAISLNFTKVVVDVIAEHADGALGFMLHTNVDRFASALVEKRHDGYARVTLALDGLSAAHDYTAEVVSGACGHPKGERSIKYELKDVIVTSFTSRTKPMTQDELDNMQSIRITDQTAGVPWGCVPLSICVLVELI